MTKEKENLVKQLDAKILEIKTLKIDLEMAKMEASWAIEEKRKESIIN